MNARGHQGLMMVDGAGDPYWSYVTSLLPCTGAAGSTSFPDAKGFNWAPTGNVAISSAQQLFGLNMAYFDGAGDYLRGNAGIFNFNGQSFTWEAFVNTSQTTKNVIASGRWGTNGGWELFAQAGKPLICAVWNGSGYHEMGGTAVLPSGATTHISVGYAAGTYYLSVGGVVDAVPNANIPASNAAFLAVLGDDRSAPSPLEFAGYLGQQRMTLGACRYTSNFSPPTAPLPTHG